MSEIGAAPAPVPVDDTVAPLPITIPWLPLPKVTALPPPVIAISPFDAVTTAPPSSAMPRFPSVPDPRMPKAVMAPADLSRPVETTRAAAATTTPSFAIPDDVPAVPFSSISPSTVETSEPVATMVIPRV